MGMCQVRVRNVECSARHCSCSHSKRKESPQLRQPTMTNIFIKLQNVSEAISQCLWVVVEQVMCTVLCVVGAAYNDCVFQVQCAMLCVIGAVLCCVVGASCTVQCCVQVQCAGLCYRCSLQCCVVGAQCTTQCYVQCAGLCVAGAAYSVVLQVQCAAGLCCRCSLQSRVVGGVCCALCYRCSVQHCVLQVVILQ